MAFLIAKTSVACTEFPIPIPKLKKGEKLQNFPGAVTTTRIPNCIWDKPNLLANTSLGSGSSQYAILA